MGVLRRMQHGIAKARSRARHVTATCVGAAVLALALSHAPIATAQSGDFAPLVRSGRVALSEQRFDEALSAFDEALQLNGASEEAGLGRAAALLRLDRPSEAEAALSALIRKRPDSANAHFFRGVARTRLGRLDDAISDLEAAEKTGGKLAVLPLRLGDALYAKGDAEGARAAYQRAIDMPGSLTPPAAFRGLGNAAYALGDDSEAVKAYGEALQLDPEDGFSALYRGWALERLGQTKQALQHFDLAVETLGGADPSALVARADLLRANGAHASAFLDYSTALEINSSDADALYGAAHSLLEQGELKGAETYINRLIDVAGDNKEIAAKALAQRGRARLLGGDPNGAERDLSLAIELAPTNALSWFNRGLARARQHDVAGALSDYREAAELAPESAAVQYAYARAAVAAGRPKEAIAATTNAENLARKDPMTERERARTLLALDRPFAALTIIDEFLAETPRDHQALELKAMAMTRLGRNTEALAFAEALIDASPNSPIGHLLEAEARIALAEPEAARAALERANALGADPATVLRLAGGAWLTEARLQSGEERPRALEQAAAALDAAVDLSDGSSKALVLRAAARERMGDLEGARRDLDRVIASRPQDAELRFARASLLKKLGECDEAIRDFDAGLSLRPDNSQARAARSSCRFEEGSIMGGVADWIGSLL